MRSRVAEIVKNAVYSEIVSFLSEGLRGSNLILSGYSEYSARYDTSDNANRGHNGSIFECLILEALLIHGIQPAYYQANLLNIPGVKYDIVLHNLRRPVVISCKTSFRERIKQAYYEGLMFKNIHREGLSYVVTMDAKEGRREQRKVDRKEAQGADQIITVAPGNSTFDELLDRLAAENYLRAEPVQPVNGIVVDNAS